ncbi:MAG: OmpA family protein [Spirosomataceae bacterium]
MNNPIFTTHMKKFLLILMLSGFAVFRAQAQVTINPLVESQSSEETKITRVELKGSYTIISFRYRLGKNRTYDEQRRPQEKTPDREPRNLQELFERMMRQGGGRVGGSEHWISIDPRSKLIAKNGRKTFHFVKAEGIPESPEQLFMEPGEEVTFKVYYDRLDRGIELFDYYEGKNDGRTVFWNFKGVHIKNPAPNELNTTPPPLAKKEPEKPKEPTPTPPVVVEKEPEKPKVVSPAEIRISGTVYDAKTKKPLDAKLVFQVKNQKIDSTQAFTGTGTYRSTLPVGNNYTCVVTAKGYAESQESIDLQNATAPVTKDIYLTPLSKGEKITLKNIYFETSKATLLSESFAELNKLAAMMKENPNMEIRLEGHTDGVGDFDMNLQLSRERVDAVKAYLVKNGIAESRIETQGYGSTRPVTSGRSEEERRKNRRVEFVITKM